MNWALNRLLVRARFGVDPLDMTWARFMQCLKFLNIAGKIVDGKGISLAEKNFLQMETEPNEI